MMSLNQRGCGRASLCVTSEGKTAVKSQEVNSVCRFQAKPLACVYETDSCGATTRPRHSRKLLARELQEVVTFLRANVGTSHSLAHELWPYPSRSPRHLIASPPFQHKVIIPGFPAVSFCTFYHQHVLTYGMMSHRLSFLPYILRERIPPEFLLPTRWKPTACLAHISSFPRDFGVPNTPSKSGLLAAPVLFAASPLPSERGWQRTRSRQCRCQ